MSTEQVQVEKKSVLVIDLSEQIMERKMDDPFAELTGEAAAPDLYTTVKLIKHASSDSLVKGIYLIAKDNPNGFATSQELRSALFDFKKNGKFIIAYGDYISQKAYHVARDRKSTRLNSSHSVFPAQSRIDRKSTRLNSSHSVFKC
jgi:protease-4